MRERHVRACAVHEISAPRPVPSSDHEGGAPCRCSNPPARPSTAETPDWLRLKAAATAFRALQQQRRRPRRGRRRRTPPAPSIEEVRDAVRALAPAFPHDAAYLAALDDDLAAWAGAGFDVPDFRASLAAFDPQRDRVDGLRHLVRLPDDDPERLARPAARGRAHRRALAGVHRRARARAYPNPLFVPIRFVDFTGGYDTNSAVLFPETVAMKELIPFTWGAIFADREAARFRRVVRRGRGDHEARAAGGRPPAARRPGASPSAPSCCGTSSTTAPTCAATCRSTRS